MGIKLSWGSGQMGPARRPQPILFIEEKKKIILPAALREVGGTGWGWGAVWGPRCFSDLRIPGLGNLVLQAVCFSALGDLGFCVLGLLKRNITVQKG